MPGMTAEAFIDEVRNGRLDFRDIDLSGEDVYAQLVNVNSSPMGAASTEPSTIPRIASRASLRGLPLKGAVLDGARLVDVMFSKVNLSGATARAADLRLVKMQGCTLHDAQLQDADFTSAVLNSADLSGADLTRTRLNGCSAQGAIFTATRLIDTSAVGGDFTNAKFERSEFVRADFRGARFQYATFSDVQIEDCDFTDATFLNCRLRNVSLSGSDMSRTFFRECVFHSSAIERVAFIGATFISPEFNTCLLVDVGFLDATIEGGRFEATRAESIDFENAKLHAIQLTRSQFVSPRLSSTSISNLNLWPLIESDPRVGSVSSIDYLSVLQTLGRDSRFEAAGLAKAIRFLRLCGLPDLSNAALPDLLKSLYSDEVRKTMKSTFISYGGPDENFAARLNADLLRSGVKTFYFPMDAVFGEKLHLTMKRVNEYERIILVCSKDSLDRPGLQYELEKVLEREAREGGTSCIIPITLDGFLFEDWQPTRPSLKEELLARVVADFRDFGKYETQFGRLLAALQAP